VRDGLDLKRMMITVVVALLPCILFSMYNTGYQSAVAIEAGARPLDNFQEAIFQALGLGYSSQDALSCLLHGALYFLPILIVTAAVGGNIEALAAVLRGHEINEGFLVTMFLFPLSLPATIPLWQVGLGIAFAIVFAKEVFGGTGMNFLNPALTGRAFLFFAYPAQISGNIWVAADFGGVDGVSGATLLGDAASSATALEGVSMQDAFLGFIPGSMGETSTLACLLGAAVLLVTKIGSFRTMLGVTLGTTGCALLLNQFAGGSDNPMMAMPFYWHLVLGGWAFGMVFMATDPVSGAFTAPGQLMYGLGIGVLVVLIRCVNPAYPEGMMLAILFMNMFAPLFDHFVVQGNIKRRLARQAA
jgi:Na+-transporting NADH:ubiquinone oxidoreductase subunit B